MIILISYEKLTTNNSFLKQNTSDAPIPDAVRNWLQSFHRAFSNNNSYELASAYESFSRLTDKHYQKSPWPSSETIAPLVNNDSNFLMFYRELYFRHVYAKLSPSLEDRFASYENYCDIFNFVLNSDGPVELDLPNQWAWDIVDEFVFQFQNYYSNRTRLVRRSQNTSNFDPNVLEDITMIKENQHVWSCYSVLNVLYSLIQKSNIKQILAANKAGTDTQSIVGEYGAVNLYRMLGYFSIIGLLRVHCLLGDFTLALMMLDDIELNKKAMFARVTSAHYQTYYYVGFAYMMLHRYADAIKALNHILPILSRSKHDSRTSQYDQVTKKGDQMCVLLAICLSLSPSRVDDQLHSLLREKYSEQQTKMARGGKEALATYEELFTFAAPKFINAVSGDFDTKLGSMEPVQFHLKIFLNDVTRWSTIQTLKSYLKLYSTMDIKKLAAFLGMETEDLRKALILYKERTRQFRWSEGDLLTGDLVNTSDVDFGLAEDIIHIAESRTGRKYGDWFLRNTIKYFGMQEAMDKQ